MRRAAKFVARPTPSPSFNYGWRLGVVIGASLVLMVSTALIAGIVGKVWDVYF